MSLPIITIPATRGSRWSAAEDELLLKLLPATDSAEDIARHLPGRTVRSIQGRLARLSSASGRKYAKSVEWRKPAGLEKLRKMASTMWNYEIAKAIGIPVQTLQKWKTKYPEIREALESGNDIRAGVPEPKREPEIKPEPEVSIPPQRRRLRIDPPCVRCVWAKPLVKSGSQVLCIWPECVKEVAR